MSGTVLLPAWNAGAKYAGDSLARSSGKQLQPTGVGGGEKGSCLSWKNWWHFDDKTHSPRWAVACTAEHSTLQLPEPLCVPAGPREPADPGSPDAGRAAVRVAGHHPVHDLLNAGAAAGPGSLLSLGPSRWDRRRGIP